MAFKMAGWSPFKQLVPERPTSKKKDTGAAGSAGKRIIEKTQIGKSKVTKSIKKKSKSDYVPQTIREGEEYSPQSIFKKKEDKGTRGYKVDGKFMSESDIKKKVETEKKKK